MTTIPRLRPRLMRRWLPYYETPNGERIHLLLEISPDAPKGDPVCVLRAFPGGFNPERQVAVLSWLRDRTVLEVEVAKGHRRQGLASEMFRRAQGECEGLKYPSVLTVEGVAWIAGMEAKALDGGVPRG